MTEEEFAEWRKNKLLYGMHWRRLVDRNTKELLKYNETALKYINGEVPQIFASGYNDVAEQVPTSPVAGFDFELVNADTVRNLVHEEGITLPKKVLDPKKDVAWNAKLINAQLLQGILQGESIPKMAKRMQTVANSDLAGATRTARTMHTAAQNYGRQTGYNKAAKQGIIFEKTWLAANQPNRTRDSHRALNGQTVPYDERFVSPVTGVELMFPGDWNAKGHNIGADIYNCRCTMVTKFKGFMTLKEAEKVKDQEKQRGWRPEDYTWKQSEVDVDSIVTLFEELDNGSYEPTNNEIEEEIQKVMPKSLSEIMTGEILQKFSDMLKKKPTERKLFFKYAKSYDWIFTDERARTTIRNEIYWNLTTGSSRSPFGVMMHEFGHAFERLLPVKDDDLTERNALMSVSCLSKFFERHSAALSDTFLDAMRKDKEAFISFYNDCKKNNNTNWIAAIEKTAALQDFATGILGNDESLRETYFQEKGIGIMGHTEKYYNRFFEQISKIPFFKNSNMKKVLNAYDSIGVSIENEEKLKMIMRDYDTASELWANFNEAFATDYELETLVKACPNSAIAFAKLVKEGIK